MDYGANHIAVTEPPAEAAQTGIQTNNKQINTDGHIDNKNESNNEIINKTDSINETAKENVDASMTAVTNERSSTTSDHTRQQNKTTSDEAKLIESKTDGTPASAVAIDKIMTIHEYAEAQTIVANNGNNADVSDNGDSKITNTNKGPALKTTQTEAKFVNNETNLLFPDSHQLHLSFMSNTLHVSPEETKSASTNQMHDQRITVIDDDDEEVTKSNNTEDTSRINESTEVEKTKDEVIDTKNNNETEIIRNPFENATEPRSVSSTNVEDKHTNKTDSIISNNEDIEANTIVITDTESSKEQSVSIDENIIAHKGDKTSNEEKKNDAIIDKKVTETEQITPIDTTINNNEKIEDITANTTTETIAIDPANIHIDNADKMDIDTEADLRAEKNKADLMVDKQPEGTTQPGMASLSNVAQVHDNISDENKTTKTALVGPTSISNDIVEEPATTESNMESQPNKEPHEDSNDKAHTTESNKTVTGVKEVANENQTSAEINKSSQLDLAEPLSDEISFLKEQNKMHTNKIASLTEQLDIMNGRCKVLEDELLKSNTTISESLNSISILMQKFVKNQDTLKREVDTVKKSQLKIDVKNVKNITKRTRREGMIMEEGDVEYRIVSRNLSNRTTSSRHDSDESRKRRHLSTEAPEYIPEPKVQTPKPKPTKVQRVATEIYEKSQPIFGTVAKPAIDLASSLKMATTNDTIDFSKGKSPQKATQNQLYARATAASMKLVRNKSGKKNVNVYEQIPSGPGIEYSTEKIETSNHANLFNLTGSPSYQEQLNSPQRRISSNLVELKHEKRILGQAPRMRRSSSSEVLSSFIKPEVVPKKVPSKNKTKIAAPAPVAAPEFEAEDDYDPNEQFNDMAVEANDDYVPQIETKKQRENTIASTQKITETNNPAPVSVPAEKTVPVQEEEPEQSQRKPTVKGFKLVLAGKFRKSIQLYIVDDIIYTGESPYSAISFVYFVDLKYSNIRKTRETTTTNFSIGFPHILIDEGDKAMEVLGSNIMTPGYLMTVEYFLGDYLQACHLVEDKLSPGCTTDYWRRCRNLFLLLMYWRQLAREKRGFRRYTMLHAVKEIENFRLHTQPKSYAISEPFFLDKKEQEKIASSGKPREWMYQAEKTLPFIGQNGITEANINSALDALLKPPPRIGGFVPYASVAVPTGVEVV